MVVQSIFAYGSVVTNKPGYSGPSLGVKIADKNTRDFTPEQLAKAKNAVPLSAHDKIMDHGEKSHRDIAFGAKSSGESGSSAVPKTSSGPTIDFGKGTTHRDIGFGKLF